MESDEYPNIVKEDEMKDAGSVLWRKKKVY
jgi:hypothetical protein